QREGRMKRDPAWRALHNAMGPQQAHLLVIPSLLSPPCVIKKRMDAAHVYEDKFFDYIEQGSDRSAQAIVPLIRRLLGSASVLDVGCGRGVWLKRWTDAGVSDITGVDGDYVPRTTLAIPATRFIAHDLSQPFDLKRRFDLVQSLEVAEHVAAPFAD